MQSSSLLHGPRRGQSGDVHPIWSEHSIIANPPSRLSSWCESRSGQERTQGQGLAAPRSDPPNPPGSIGRIIAPVPFGQRRQYTREKRCLLSQSLSPVRFREGEPEESPCAGGHRLPKPSGVVESLGHHRGGNCEAALYVVRCGHSPQR
jgi:hypothetical protein